MKIAELVKRKKKKKKGNAWLFLRHCHLLPGAKGTMGDVVFTLDAPSALHLLSDVWQAVTSGWASEAIAVVEGRSFLSVSLKAKASVSGVISKDYILNITLNPIMGCCIRLS